MQAESLAARGRGAWHSISPIAKMAGMAMTHFTPPNWMFKAFLLLAAAIWGLGTVVIKDIVYTVSPAWLVGFRFTFAGLILGAFIFPKLRRRLDASHVRIGALLGVILFLEYWLNSLGLTDTTASKSAFLTSCYCVLVPFLGWLFLRRRPTRFNIMAALVCVVGVGFISLSGSDSLSLGFGDGITLVSALFVALEVITVARFAGSHDILVLTCVQFFVSGILGFGGALVAEPLPDFAHIGLDVWLGLAYLAAFASCATITLQNTGLAHVEPAQGSLLLATESVFGTLFAGLFLGESLTVQLAIGFGLVFAAIVISEYLPQRFGQSSQPQQE